VDGSFVDFNGKRSDVKWSLTAAQGQSPENGNEIWGYKMKTFWPMRHCRRFNEDCDPWNKLQYSNRDKYVTNLMLNEKLTDPA
jgi:hypothetical protein